MKPFKKGFVTKCASYGIPKEEAKEMFSKIAGALSQIPMHPAVQNFDPAKYDPKVPMPKM